jgi:lipopolysaccharide/colanic/teichoic acid biosynthesis glycosyltransferase
MLLRNPQSLETGPIGPAGLAAKRAIDLLIAVPALMLFGPVMLAIAVAIRLESPGPALFRQDRLGRHGREFVAVKFRSMVVGAADGEVREGERDPRITRVGRVLRRTSLDELPQFLNVLWGDMSVVGPRPDRVWRLGEYSERDRIRLEVKPGITGLAQVGGRNALPRHDRLRLDVEYVETWSPGLDLRILGRTLGAVVRAEGIDYS